LVLLSIKNGAYVLKLIISFLIISLFGCNDGEKKMSINYFESGSQILVKCDNKTKAEIIEHLSELFLNTTDRLRVHLSENRINHLKATEKLIEIKLDSAITLNSIQYGDKRIDLILLPLSGDYIGDENDPVITMIVGNKTYSTGPYRNKNGLETLNKIKSLVEKEN
jgi:hypothetical protein